MIASLLNPAPDYDAQTLPSASGLATGPGESFDALLAQPGDRKPDRSEPARQPAAAADRRTDRASRDESSTSEPANAAEPTQESAAAATNVNDPSDEGYPDDATLVQDGDGLAESSDDTTAGGAQASSGHAEADTSEQAVDVAASVIAEVAAALAAPLAEPPATVNPVAADQAAHPRPASPPPNATPSDATTKPTPAFSVAVVDRPTGQAPTAEGSSLKPVDAQAPAQATTNAAAGGDTADEGADRQAGQQGNPTQHAARANVQPTNFAATASATSSPASLAPDAPDPGLATRNTANDATAARPAATATALAAPSADADPDAANAARLARGLQSALNQRGGGVTLRLTPAEMGTIRIRLDIAAGRVAAEFQPTTQAGQQLLQGQLAQLRTSLESQGLTVDRLGVQPAASANNGSAAQNNASFNQSQQDNPDGRQSSTDGRSRGEYGRSPQSAPDDATEDTAPADTFDDALHTVNPLAANAAGA